jgi:uncharacterized low-complexity protein
MSIKRTVIKAGLASALLLSAASFAAAENNDPLAHTKTPGLNGQCWKTTDARGDGYWTTCQRPTAAVRPRGASSFAAAENNDRLAHTKTPGLNGQCWKTTDARGDGYWTTCQ